MAWLILCVPGNVITICISLKVLENSDFNLNPEENTTKLECQELKDDWKEIVAWSQYLIQGIFVMIVSVCGVLANILSILVLVHCQNNRNFHRLLIGLAVVDILLVVDLGLGTSIFGVFLKEEPHWYVVTYPFLIHPGRGFIRTSAIYMVVAVSTERYR